MQDAPLKGPIADVFLPRLIARLHRDGFEGLLRLTLHDATKIIYFRRGDIASAASNAEPDRLANVLIRDGRLTQAQLDLARTRIQEGGSLGKALIEMGFLTPSELLEGARSQVREILASCFTLSGGSYQVEPGSPPTEVTSLGLPTKRLIFDCLIEIADRPAIVREMGSMESVYRPLASLEAGLAALKLDGEMDRIGRLLDGVLTLREISGRTSLDDFGVSKLVLTLEILGLVERVGPPVARAEAKRGRRIVIDPETGQPEPEAAITGPVPAAPADTVPGSVRGEPEVAPEEAGPTPEEPRTELPPIETPPEEKAAAESPPIANEELPAFALPAAAAQWQIDPETGERVHVGPIEVTFEGAIPAGRRERPTLPRLLGMTAVVTAVLAGLIGYLVTRQGGRAPDAVVASRPAAAVDPQPAVPAAPPPREAGDGVSQPSAEAAPAPKSAETPREEAKPGGADRTSGTPGPTTPAPPATVNPPPRPAEPPVAGPAKVERGPEPAASAPASAPPTASEPAPATMAPSAPFKNGPGYLAAVRQLDAGDPRGSARAFQALLASEDPGTFTLQIMIACQEETVKGARARSGDGGAFFHLPYSLKGRDCFRACWGIYPTKEAALQAIPTLPDVFRGSGSRPLVLPLAGLRTAD